MQITKEFCEQEIVSLEREIEKARHELEHARAFLIRAEAAISVHRMLLNKLDQPEPEAKPQEEIKS